MALSKSEANKLKKLGKRIRDLRLEKKMTLEDVESCGGPTWRHLIKIEHGKNHNVTTLMKVADALGVHPGKLLDDE